jgi:hypothetical protein
MREVEKTADGVDIVEGLRVWDNNLNRGVVHLPADYLRGDTEWFEVLVDMDSKGNPKSGWDLMDKTRVATRFDGVDA